MVLCASLGHGLHAGELEEETLHLVERLNFKGSKTDFSFPPGTDEVSKICWRLGKIGPEGRDAIPTLIHLLDDEQNSRGAMFAFGRIGGEAAPALLQAVEDASGTVLLLIIGILGEIGTDAATAIPELIDMLDSDDFDIRYAAFEALSEIDVPSEQAVADLIKLLRHDARLTRVMAARTLGKLGQAEEVIPALTKASTDDSPDVRCEALRAIVRLDATGFHAAPALVKALGDHGVSGNGGVRLVGLRQMRRAQELGHGGKASFAK